MANDFDPWLSGTIAGEVMALGQASAASIELHRQRRLALLIERARSTTRLWSRRLAGVAPGAPLAALPVLDKAELMAQFDDALADPALDRRRVAEHLADACAIGQPLAGRYIVWESSGTQGQPTYFVQDRQAMAVYDALEALRPRPRSLLPGPVFGGRMAFVGAIGGHFASQVSVQRLRRLNPWLALSLRSFSILQPTPELLRQLQAWSPAVLATYPTAAAMLADEQQHGRLNLRLSEVLTGGETLDPMQRMHIERAFGCPLRNSYGASEFLAMASQCEQGTLHLNADWVILEPVDREGRAVPGGDLSHTTLLTNLANQVQPLIRVDIGDRVRLLTRACSCGSPLPAIEVVGRVDEAIVMRGARGRNVTLLPMALCTVLEDEAGVFDFQLCRRDARTLSLRLGGRDAPNAEIAAQRFARCREVLLQWAHDQGVRDLRLIDEPGVAPAAGRSGKVQRVIARAEGG